MDARVRLGLLLFAEHSLEDGQDDAAREEENAREERNEPNDELRRAVERFQKRHHNRPDQNQEADRTARTAQQDLPHIYAVSRLGRITVGLASSALRDGRSGDTDLVWPSSAAVY